MPRPNKDDKLILFLFETDTECIWLLEIKGRFSPERIEGAASSIELAMKQVRSQVTLFGYSPDHPIERGTLPENNPNWQPPDIDKF